MKNLLNFSYFYSLLFLVCLAVTIATQSEANTKVDAEGAIGGMNSKFDEIFDDSDSNQHKKAAGFEGTNVKGSNMSLTEAEGEGTINREKKSNSGAPKCNKDNCELGEVFSAGEMLKREEKMDEHGFTRNSDMMPDKHHGYMNKALNYIKNTKEDFDYLKGGYKNCEPTETILTTNTEDICDEYHNTKINTCFPEQIVEIDTKYNYLCNKIRESKVKTCTDQITSISCKQNSQCDMGGINPGSMDSDISFWFDNGELLMGKQDYAGWGGFCTSYDRKATFELINIDKIKEFTLIHVRFDDYIEIDVNGQRVFAGPDGGATKAEVVQGKNFFGSSLLDDGTGQLKSCERSTDWHRQPNINLIPYLHEGQNTIRFKVVTTGTGTGSLKIRAKQICCVDWEIKREEKCNFS